MNYEKISELEDKNIEGKIFLVRAGLNIPVFEGKIENDFRLKKILETINFLLKKKVKIILLGHLGRKKDENLELIFEWLKKNIKNKIYFDKNTFLNFNEKSELSSISEKILELKNGEILLLDNLRMTELEKENSFELAQKISSLGDFYINEAFSVSHRKHMSVDELPKNFSEGKIFLGFQFQKELENIERIKNISNKNSIFILGGSKISTKIPMLEKMLEKFDLIILGGGVANSFYKKLGDEIGDSMIDEKFIFEEKLFEKLINSEKIFLPNIVITENGEKEISEIKKKEKILDISPNAFIEIEEKLKNAEFIFFNGPVGFYEGGYEKGTKFLLEILANKNNYFVAGGGNTISAIFELGLEKNVDFISTGGGALIKKLSE
jgi:phosphoglycerate kinase